MSVVVVIFAAVFLLTTAAPAAATQLGDVAATMTVGSWARVTTTNAGIISQWFNAHTSAPTPGYDDSCMVWNSKKRRAYIITATHNGGSYASSPLWQFDDATNAWTEIAPSVNPTGYAHCYDGLAWDDDHEVLYWRPGGYGSPNIYRYCVNATPAWCGGGRQGTWSLLPSPFQTYDACYTVTIALTYVPTMDGGSLLCFDSERGISQYKENPAGGDGTWSNIIPGTNIFPGQALTGVCMEYSPPKRITIFGCGGTSAMYKIDDNKTVTRIADGPALFGHTGVGQYNQNLIAEPVSGNFIMIGGTVDTTTISPSNKMYAINPDGTTGNWTLIDPNLADAGEICAVKFNSSAACSWEFYSVPNPTYGVLMFWHPTSAATAEVWLYKHKPLTAPTPPSSLTVR